MIIMYALQSILVVLYFEKQIHYYHILVMLNTLFLIKFLHINK